MENIPGEKDFACDPVRIESGSLSGLNKSNQTRVFLGVPYAAPPVGDLRWRPPQPPIPWPGVRHAGAFGPSSIQFAPPAKSIYFGGETQFSEDCLYLNVYTGSGGDSKRPVLVWFHFGAFMFGSSSNPVQDGTNLAAEGITVVTVNYRLGRLGFLSHPELSAESGHKASGNYGLMDQIAALEWVQRNIEIFGGDPGNVTIGGASAGGSSVLILRSSPLLAGKSLFSKAICESGPGLAPPINGHGHAATFMTLTAAEEAGSELLNLLEVPSISHLRALPAEKIMTAHLPRGRGPWKSNLWPGSSSLSIFDTANPIIDGYVLSQSPLAAFASGDVVDVPMLAGNVGNEGSGLPHLASVAEYRAYVKSTFGAYADEALGIYPVKSDSEAWDRSSQLLADQVFVYSTWTAARLQARNLHSSVWYYEFLRAPPIPLDSEIIEREFAGAFHVAGTPYAFGNLDAWQWNWTEGDKSLSNNIMEAWVSFMKGGDPNKERTNDGGWLELSPSKHAVKLWDIDSRSDLVGSRFSEKISLWDKLYGVTI